jgi:hypothetical protein
MKDIFSIVTFTAAAISFAVFLTSFQFDNGMPEAGWNPTVTAAAYVSGSGCPLRGPLLADSRDGLSVLSHLHDV